MRLLLWRRNWLSSSQGSSSGKVRIGLKWLCSTAPAPWQKATMSLRKSSSNTLASTSCLKLREWEKHLYREHRWMGRTTAPRENSRRRIASEICCCRLVQQNRLAIQCTWVRGCFMDVKSFLCQVLFLKKIHCFLHGYLCFFFKIFINENCCY